MQRWDHSPSKYTCLQSDLFFDRCERPSGFISCCTALQCHVCSHYPDQARENMWGAAWQSHCDRKWPSFNPKVLLFSLVDKDQALTANKWWNYDMENTNVHHIHIKRLLLKKKIYINNEFKKKEEEMFSLSRLIVFKLWVGALFYVAADDLSLLWSAASCTIKSHVWRRDSSWPFWSAVNRKGWRAPFPLWASLQDNEQVLRRQKPPQTESLLVVIRQPRSFISCAARAVSGRTRKHSRTRCCLGGKRYPEVVAEGFQMKVRLPNKADSPHRCGLWVFKRDYKWSILQA